MYFHIGHIRRILFHGTKKEERRKAGKTINDKREMGRQKNTAQTP